MVLEIDFKTEMMESGVSGDGVVDDDDTTLFLYGKERTKRPL